MVSCFICCSLDLLSWVMGGFQDRDSRKEMGTPLGLGHRITRGFGSRACAISFKSPLTMVNCDGNVCPPMIPKQMIQKIQRYDSSPKSVCFYISIEIHPMRLIKRGRFRIKNRIQWEPGSNLTTSDPAAGLTKVQVHLLLSRSTSWWPIWWRTRVTSWRVPRQGNHHGKWLAGMLFFGHLFWEAALRVLIRCDMHGRFYGRYLYCITHISVSYLLNHISLYIYT